MVFSVGVTIVMQNLVWWAQRVLSMCHSFGIHIHIHLNMLTSLSNLTEIYNRSVGKTTGCENMWVGDRSSIHMKVIDVMVATLQTVA